MVGDLPADSSLSSFEEEELYYQIKSGKGLSSLTPIGKASKLKTQRFHDLFEEVRNTRIEKLKHVTQNSESKKPSPELLELVQQLQSVKAETVFAHFQKAHIKEKYWRNTLEEIFMKPYQWC